MNTKARFIAEAREATCNLRVLLKATGLNLVGVINDDGDICTFRVRDVLVNIDDDLRVAEEDEKILAARKAVMP